MLIYLYFASEKDNKDLINCHKTERVTRIIPKTAAVANAALEQLFIGPTEKEMKDGQSKMAS